MIAVDAPLLLDAEEAAAFCRGAGAVARSTWYDWSARGVIPAPVKVRGRAFWRRDDLALWVALECPGRERFEAERTARAGVNARRKPGGPR